MRDPIALLKDAARVTFARGLSAVSDAQEALVASGERARNRLGLPTQHDLDRLHKAVELLDRAVDSFPAQS